MIKLTVLSGPDAGQEFTFEGAEIVIGKSHTCEVVLHDAYVGRRHCRILQQGNHYFLEDLESKNGTFLNDRERRLSSPQQLEATSQLFVGSTCIQVEVSMEGEAKTVLTQPEERETQQQRPSSAPSSRLETGEAHSQERLIAVRQPEAPIVITVVNGPDRGMVYSPPQEVFTIGRSETCDIALHDIRISRTHVSIKREGGRYRLYDENTTNGTFLRAPTARVFHAELVDNDVIYLGQTQLRVELRAPASTTPPPSDDDATRISGTLHGRDFTFALPARGVRRTLHTQAEENVFQEADLTELGIAPSSPPSDSQTEEPQGPQLTLQVIEGQEAGTKYSPPPHTKTFTVGRGQNADFRLQERGASRLHFSIEIGPTKVELIDQGSLNGTFVNNGAERVSRVELRNGDEIRIYNTRLKVELAFPDEPTIAGALPITPAARQGEPSSPAPQALLSPDHQNEQSATAHPQVENVESRSTTFKKRLAEIEKQKGVILRPFTMPGSPLQWATFLLLIIGLASSYGFFLLGRPASFSGGALIDGHVKKVQNDCAQCHPPWGVQSINVTCVASGCHNDVLKKGKEHVRFTPQRALVRDDCVSCHTEHRGHDFDITGNKSRGVEFDLTGNKTGTKTFCWQCHANGVQTRRFQARPLATYYDEVVLVTEASPSSSRQSANPLQSPVPPTEQPRLAWLQRVDAQESGLKYGHTIHDRQVFEKDGARLDCMACHAQAKTSIGQQSASSVEGGIAFPTHAQCIDCHVEVENRDPQVAKNHPSDKCLLCHTTREGGVTRVPSLVNYVNFSHESHTKAYLACERCHAVVLGETEYRPVLRSASAYPVPMNACYGCHENSKDRFPNATVACLDCHGSHHNYAPPSSTMSSWLAHLSLSNVLLAMFVMVAGLTVYSYADARMARRWQEEEETAAPAEEELPASAAGSAPPAGEGDVLPFPTVDASTCISCGKCYDSCPTNVLASEPDTHKSIVVHPEVCKSLEGCRICQDGCPTGAIRVTAGPPIRNVERAQMDEHNESNIPGLFLIGEVIGAAQIKKAVNQGDQVIRYIAERKPRLTDAPYDVIIVGAGPAGLGAALEAKRKKLKYLLLERATVASTIRDYPRDKAVLGEPVLLPQYGLLPMPNTAQKEELIVAWEKIIQDNGLQIHEREEVLDIQKTNALFTVTTSQGHHTGAYVVVAIGTRGNPRKIGAQGEDLPKVAYNLIDAAEFVGKKILVVGGGDSAIEAAVALAKQQDTTVHISYRRGEFSRIKPKNADALAEQEEAGRVTILFHSTVTAIHDTTVTLHVGEETQGLDNDMVFALIGADPPNDWLKKLGIEIVTMQEVIGDQW